MAVASSQPHVEDVYSVGSRISWSAILAGAAVALAIQFLLGILSATIGMAVADNAESSTMANSRPIWAILVACVALFTGGLVTSRLTAGEDHTEAVLYGVVTWAVVVAIMAHGLASGREMLGDMRQTSSSTAINRNWETPARNSGMSDAQIAEMRKVGANSNTTPTERTTASTNADLRRGLWYTFAGIWLSMAAAAGGALVGAGPTFRLGVVRHSPSVASVH